jgi:hypothetical protein
MLMIAAALVLTTVVGGLISAFWIEARHGIHDPTPDVPVLTRPEPIVLTWTP